MKRFIRGVAIAVAAIAPAVTTIAPSAQAATVDVFSQFGQGVIAPGLGITPEPQGFNFFGSGSGIGTDGVVVFAGCDAYGNDVIGTIELGEGNAAITCTVGDHSVTVNASFVRVGPVVVVISAGGVLKLGTGVCAFEANGNPLFVTSYTLACEAVYVQAP